MSERAGSSFFSALQRRLAVSFLISGVVVAIENVVLQYGLAFWMMSLPAGALGVALFILAAPFAATAIHLRPSFGVAQRSEREGSKGFFLLQMMLAASFLVLGVLGMSGRPTIELVILQMMSGGLGFAYFVLAALSFSTARHLQP